MDSLEQRIEYLEGVIASLVKSDKFILQKDLMLQDGRNIILPKGTGTQIATESTQKLGFFGATPISRPAAPGAVTVTGLAQDSVARTAINEIIIVLSQAEGGLGLTA